MATTEKPFSVLLQGAMKLEVEQFISACRSLEERTLYDHTFHIGWIGNCRVVVSMTGIGIVNATIATMLGIEHFSPSLVVNQGIAGGYAESIHTGDVVIGQHCRSINSYKTPYRKQGEGSNPFDWQLSKRGMEEIAGDAETMERMQSFFAKRFPVSVHSGTLGSGDLFNKEVDRIQWMNRNWGVLSEDMESIGVYSVCRELGVPCVGIRIISNNELLNEPLDKTKAALLQGMLIEFLLALQ